MVTVGFVVEGDSEAELVSSDIFRNSLQKHSKLRVVDPVVNAGGNGEQCSRNIELHVNRLRTQATPNRVVVLADLDPDVCAPCIGKRKEIIGSQGIDLVVIAKQAIESWFLADTAAMQRWLDDPNFYESKPELPTRTSWDRLKEVSRERERRGPGNSKVIFARRMVRDYQFDVTRAAQHLHCPSAHYFVERLRRLVTG